MNLSLLLVVAFLLGVLVARLAGWWFLARVVGVTAWMAGYMFILRCENVRLLAALDAEQARDAAALRRAQLELASQVGTRRP